MNELCKCGRPIYQRPFTTIKNKNCPTCTLKQASGKQETGQKAKIWRIPGKVSAGAKKGQKKPKERNPMKLADDWFSRYIRVKYSIVVDGEFYCKDIITGKIYKATRLDNGHYQSRRHMATRYDEDNCRPQNRSSNRFQGEADKEKFRTNLIKEIGQERFDAMEAKSRNPVFSYSRNDFVEIAETFRLATNELLKSKGGKRWW